MLDGIGQARQCQMYVNHGFDDHSLSRWDGTGTTQCQTAVQHGFNSHSLSRWDGTSMAQCQTAVKHGFDNHSLLRWDGTSTTVSGGCEGCMRHSLTT